MRLTKLTYWVLIAAVMAVIGIMVGGVGLIPGLDFGCGQYYYTDIPDWQRYFNVRGVEDSFPRWVYYLLFAMWGGLMYLAWLWLNRRMERPSDDNGKAEEIVKGAFPIFLSPITNSALVVGVGKIAAHKALLLRSFALTVDQCDQSEFDKLNPKDYALVVAATSDRVFNRHVSEVCRAARVQVNVVDDPELCSCYFAAIERKGPLTIAVSSNGACPVAAQVVRERIRPLLTDELITTTERLGREREEWKRKYPLPECRAAAMRKEFRGC